MPTSRFKLRFAAVTAAIFVIAALICIWTTVHYVRVWIVPPGLPSIADNAPGTPALISAAPVVEPPNVTGEAFFGTWTGHWDNTYAARFQISRGNAKHLVVRYEYETVPGQPMTQQELRPFPSNTVLHMPRAAVTLTLSTTTPNTVEGICNFKADGVIHVRTATFVRDGALPKTNWLVNDSSTGGLMQPILLDIKANIDGSDVLNISPIGAVWTHKAFRWPTDLTVNGIAWDAHTTPALRDTGLSDADFSTAWVISRNGRDLAAMEKTADGIAIYFDDAPAGAAPYEIKIGMTHKTGTGGIAARSTGDPIFLDVQAAIGGSDCLMISSGGAQWLHRRGEFPTHVQINGTVWDPQNKPKIDDIGLSAADLSSATVIERSGRDALVVEKTNTAGLAIYFDDGSGGTGPYHVKLRFDRKQPATH